MADLRFYVYFHYRNDTNQVFYIGKGRNRRAWQSSNRNRYWHNIVNKCGYRYEIIEYYDSELDALSREELLIKEYRDEGYVLANVCSGGKCNSGFRHTAESKEKLRIAHTGRKLSKERIEKQRLKMTGVPKSISHRRNLSIAKTGIKVQKAWKPVMCIDNNMYYESLQDAAANLGVDISHIVKCCKGKLIQTKGLSFIYV